MAKPKPPLDGIRVLDFSRFIAGPLCTQQLADLGAEVIKVENTTTGDDFRGVGADGKPARSPFFMGFNRTKQSVAIDLKSPEGTDLALQLAGHCDVLVENFRPGVMERFGLDHATMRARYPRLIYLSISAFGEGVPMAGRPGFDPVLQAESGMMELTGEPDGQPMRTGLSLIDTLTASHGATAVCAALLARQQSGTGDHIDLALLDTAIGALGNMAMTYLATGEVPTRAGNSHFDAIPTDLFRTQTKSIYLAVSSNRLFRQFCVDVLDRPDVPDDPRFAGDIERREHRAALKALIEDILLTQPATYWLARASHLPAGQVRTLDKALASDEVRARHMVQTIVEDDGSEKQLLGSNFKFADTPLQPAKQPPRHGQHTDAVLADLLGLDAPTLARLRAEGVTRQR